MFGRRVYGAGAIELVRGIIFDLDGVLCRTDGLHAVAWEEIARREGIPFDPEDADRLRGVSRERSLEILLGRAERTYSAEEKAELCELKATLFRASLSGLGPDDLSEGADRLLRECAGCGVRCAVASSSRNAGLILDRLGITPRFAAVVDGNADCPPKPAPDPFLLAARRLGLPPGACVVIEDAAVGIEGAIAAGMRVVGIGRGEVVGGADLVVRGLEELPLGRVLGLRRRAGAAVLQRSAASRR